MNTISGQLNITRNVAASSSGGVLQRACACGNHAPGGGECEACKKKRLQRQAVGVHTPPVAPPIVHDVLRSPGQPLEPTTRAFMEPRFGHDFSRVRVHTDPQAAEAARAVGAHGYTVGNHVAFGHGQYAPATTTGQRLLAHELAHVVQQRSAATFQTRLAIGAADTSAEREAEAVAEQVLAASGHERRATTIQATPAAVQRLGDLSKVPPGLELECEIASTSPPSPTEILLFGNKATALLPLQQAQIDNFVINWRAAGANASVRVDGFASTPDTDELNWRLSCDRAKAVKDALMHPSSGIVGIPESFIHTVAQGETSEFGADANNRRATISSTFAQPPSPTPPTPSPTPPTPPSPPSPAATGPLCGPDVTAQITAAIAKTNTTFSGWSGAEKESQCDALDSLTTGAVAWDIVDLHNNSWILGYRPACATQGATPPCGSTVKVNSDCYYAGSPNYVIYGVMCRLCNSYFTSVGNTSGADRFTQTKMLYWINFYKGTGPLGISTPSANFGPSRDWAITGYNGWPGASTPPGDRNTCAASCPTPYTGSAFRVNWLPHGQF